VCGKIRVNVCLDGIVGKICWEVEASKQSFGVGVHNKDGFVSRIEENGIGGFRTDAVEVE
jgi:hypothetical protein